MAAEIFVGHPTAIPCVQTFFRCEETLPGDGSGAMVDAVGGAVFNPLAAATIAGATGTYSLTNQTGLTQGVYAQSDSPLPLVSGSLPNFERKSVIIFACCRLVDGTAFRVPFGDGGSPNSTLTNQGGLLSLSFVGGMHLLANTSNAQIASASDAARVLPADGTDIGLIVEYVPGTSLMGKVVDMNGATFGSGATETILTTATVTLADVNPSLNNKTRFGGALFYSVMAFTFTDGLPANREQVYKWMLKQHAYGNRQVPPAWQYLAA